MTAQLPAGPAATHYPSADLIGIRNPLGIIRAARNNGTVLLLKTLCAEEHASAAVREDPTCPRCQAAYSKLPEGAKDGFRVFWGILALARTAMRFYAPR